MKRSLSRASRVSVDAQDSAEISLPGIPDAKWHEFLEKEDNDLFILGLREEIFQKCLEICFEKYLERQTVTFTVHCAYLAWCKVLNIYYMFRDPADIDDPEGKESWKPDPEPEPSIVDTWGSQCLEVKDFKAKEVVSREIKPKKLPCEYYQVAEDSLESESIQLCSFMSGLFDLAEEGGFLYSPDFSFTSSEITRKKSIFTRTLSMSQDSLPLIKPLENMSVKCHKTKPKNQHLKKRAKFQKKKNNN